jgi:ribonuclease P protein component
MKLVTLKKRREFLRLRGGARFHGKGFVLEGKRRETEGPDVSAGPGRCDGARFGFTVTKRLGGAVRRNGIRRRLKAAVGVASDTARSDTDYVIIAKPAAFDMPFTALVGDFETGFQIVNRRLDAGLDRAGARPRRNRRRHGSGNHTNDPSNTAGGNKAGGVGR